MSKTYQAHMSTWALCHLNFLQNVLMGTEVGRWLSLVGRQYSYFS